MSESRESKESKRLPGLIVKSTTNYFTVETPEGRYVCQPRGILKEEHETAVQKEEKDDTDICALGDHVEITVQPDGSGIIEWVAERERALSRSVMHGGARGAVFHEREQVIVANPDQVVFIFSAMHPDPNPRVLDRLLVVAEKERILEVLIVVNKMDLVADDEEDEEWTRETFRPYEEMGYRVLYTSAETGEGIDELREFLRGGEISAFTGPSGVGKTSLLNAVQPGLGLRVAAVSDATQKGRHTTRTRELFALEEVGGYVADTPGIRAIGIWDVEPDELDAYFIDIAPYVADCAWSDCAHLDEEGCAVLDAVEAGAITIERWDSYARLRDELEELYYDQY